MKYLFDIRLFFFCFSCLGLFSACGSDPCSFNIDKYEILTGLDIPKTHGAVCLPYEEQGFKLSAWRIDTAALRNNDYYSGINNYISHFKFEKLEGEVNSDKLNLLPDDYRESVLSGELFYKKGERRDQKWIMIINKTTGYLFGEVIYLDIAEN